MKQLEEEKHPLHIQYMFLLYRQECFTEKYTTRKIHTKLHPGLEWRISISSLVRILMTPFHALSQLFVHTVGEKWQAIDLSV